jgi:putative ATPase
MHLRDAHYQGAAKLGHGAGYDYPHDDPSGWVPQEYRPPEVAGRVYYRPSGHGFEQEIATRMAEHGAEQDDGGQSDG